QNEPIIRPSPTNINSVLSDTVFFNHFLFRYPYGTIASEIVFIDQISTIVLSLHLSDSGFFTNRPDARVAELADAPA
ncbi:MAG: hypothetical protein FWH49_06815, partial [Clostridiales bacterium]|nr:hypothetical protein [Clostridiales bacterium]